MVHNNPEIDLVSDNEYTHLVKSCPFILKIWSKNQSIVVNLRKTKIYNTNVDLVNDNVYTILVSICLFVLKIWSKKQILTSIKGRNSVANLRKTMICNNKADLVNDNVNTKFGFNRSIRFQDIEQKLNSVVNQGP